MYKVSPAEQVPLILVLAVIFIGVNKLIFISSPIPFVLIISTSEAAAPIAILKISSC